MTLSFHRYEGLGRVWAFARMGISRLALPRVPGIGFWKLLGSGAGEGFSVVPNPGVYAILATWGSEAEARAGLAARVFRLHRARAAESWTVILAPTSVRGAWSGRVPFAASGPVAEGPVAEGPVAALTRATIRPRALRRFWGRVPAISDRVAADANVVFRIGVGEVPFFHQVTFSIWPDAAAMAAFARQSGPHAEAIRAVRAEGWFREELYARFQILGEAGTWGGMSPLASPTA